MTTFYFTMHGFFIPSCTGTISLLSSALMARVILSQSNDFNMYHIIMLFMAFWDIIFSACIALASIPMPKDVRVIYPFEGPVYGNTYTCEAQAFLILTSGAYLLFTNTMLSIYYACTIRYQIPEDVFRKYAWPTFLVFSTIFAFLLSIPLLANGSLNPTPYESYCSVAKYPHNCNEEDIPCIRGIFSSALLDYFEIYIYTFVGIQLVVLVTSMLLILYTFNQSSNKMWRRDSIPDLEGNAEISNNRVTKEITVQAMMYFAAFILTWSFTIVSFFIDNKEIAIAKQIFQPLQGFYNVMIFFYHKIFNLQRCEPDLTTSECLWAILRNSQKIPTVYISEISIVERDIYVETQTRRAAEVAAAICGNSCENESSVRISGVSSRDLIGLSSGCSNTKADDSVAVEESIFSESSRDLIGFSSLSLLDTDHLPVRSTSDQVNIYSKSQGVTDCMTTSVAIEKKSLDLEAKIDSATDDVVGFPLRKGSRKFYPQSD